MTDLVLGIDGGGSKTLLCLADRDGHIVMSARAGGSNPMDNPRWRDEFTALAAQSAPFHDRVVQASIAVPGYHESAAMDREVDAAMPGVFPGFPLDLENDVFVAHDAALLGRAGVLLLAGTGSMAVMRSADGKLGRVGGWGDVIGDEGSAHWIGREALGLATRSLDGRADARALTSAILAAMGGPADNPKDAIFDWLTSLDHPRSQIAALSRVVAQLAERGDVDALQLIDQAAALLAEHVIAGRHVAGLGPAGPWSLLGGLGSSPLIRHALEARLGPMTPPALPPCGGALWRAATRARWTIDDAWLDNIRTGLQNNSAAEPPQPKGSPP